VVEWRVVEWCVVVWREVYWLVVGYCVAGDPSPQAEVRWRRGSLQSEEFLKLCSACCWVAAV